MTQDTQTVSASGKDIAIIINSPKLKDLIKDSAVVRSNLKTLTVEDNFSFLVPERLTSNHHVFFIMLREGNIKKENAFLDEANTSLQQIMAQKGGGYICTYNPTGYHDFDHFFENLSKDISSFLNRCLPT
jgi:hypothetical protein